jgi:hypothetical protein
MGKIHHMKIMPGSETEVYFMELLGKVGVNPRSVICRLGEVFGTPYNEYVLSDGLYTQIREYLLETKGPLASNG